MKKPIKTYVLDLFCGAGGTSTSISESYTNIEVVACVNHDKNAILSHTENHPNCLHFTEDIRTIDISPIAELFKRLRSEDPTCKVAIWASLECTQFSRAKCGPKEADSRTLAEDMFRYLDAIQPDFFWVENVEEFLTWGPLEQVTIKVGGQILYKCYREIKGKKKETVWLKYPYEDNEMYYEHFNLLPYESPVKDQLGVDYKIWVDKLTTKYFSKEYFQEKLVSADFGGLTIRKRLFLQFAKNPKEIGYPTQTHFKAPEENQKSWNPVKQVLNLDNYGKSIFTRKKPLVPKTHEVTYKGLLKYGPKEGVEFGFTYYGNSGSVNIEGPCPTLTTKDRVALIGVKPIYLKQSYGKPTFRGLNEPFGTLVVNPKGDLVSVKRSSFLLNPQYGGSSRSSEKPAATLIARQDKAPLSVVVSDYVSKDVQKVIETSYDSDLDHIEIIDGKVVYRLFPERDDEWLIKIKEYMYENNLIDVCMRPLEISEMLQIQGFPKDYKLVGTQTEQKKYIGNSVEVNVGIALFQAIDKAIQNVI